MLFAYICVVTAYAATPTRVATHKYWHVWTQDTQKGRHCFITSTPNTKTPRNVRRGEVVFSIANRPADNIFHEISVRNGYVFKVASEPYAEIEGKDFIFFSGTDLPERGTSYTQGHVDYWAWPAHIAQTPRIITAMKQANELFFHGISQRGTLTKDSYSLAGVTKALALLDSLCPKP